MAADMNDEPLERSEQDHATREAVIHAAAIRAAIKAARGLDEQEREENADA